MSHSEDRVSRAPPKPLSRIAVAGLVLVVLATLAALLPGPAYRFGGWSLDTAFAALRWAVYAGMGAAVVAIIGAILADRAARTAAFLMPSRECSSAWSSLVSP
jgi:protein-S-isoprenylcysteine O-methyltransferase Ste14